MNKIAIYTAIMGKIDNIIDPEIITPDVDYICFTDELRHKSDIWKFVKVDNEFENLRYKAREIKLNPHKYLDGYDYSLWVDGNIRILKNLNSFFEDLINEKVSIATFKHFSRNCIYEEAVVCALLKKADYQSIYNQVKYCIDDNYPTTNGLAETNVMFRMHNNDDVVAVMQMWWDCVYKRCIRDQLSFNYCVYKKKLDVFYLKGNARFDISDFCCIEHRTEIFNNIFLKIKKIMKFILKR